MELYKKHISDLGRIVTGKTPRTSISDNYGGEIPFLTPSDDLSGKYAPKTNKTITQLGLNEVKNCLLPPKSVCVSCIGSDLGKAVITNEPTVTNQQFNSIIPNEENDADFIYYLMTAVGKHLNFLSKTSTAVPIINKSTFSDYEIVVPSISEQRRIAKVLSSLDDEIEVNRRINDNLEQQAQALFKSWFVDFEPFKDQPFEESELGMIPKGWKVYSMDELVKVIGGYSYKGSELHDSNIAMATIKNFNRNGGFKTDGFKEIIPSPKAKPDQYLSKYDILIAHTDLTQNADIIGNPALLLNYGDYERIIMSMDLVKVISKIDSITYGLLYSIFADSRFKSHALGYVNGTTVLHLSKKSVPEYKIALPCELTTVNQYGLILNSIFEKESFVIDESRRLLELRDTLLPRLMSGELIIAQ